MADALLHTISNHLKTEYGIQSHEQRSIMGEDYIEVEINGTPFHIISKHNGTLSIANGINYLGFNNLRLTYLKEILDNMIKENQTT